VLVCEADGPTATTSMAVSATMLATNNVVRARLPEECIAASSMILY
jgi:hypothetical protein